MRRGLIHWSQEELPSSAIDARVARLQDVMRNEQLGAVLVYSSFAQPAATQWLANFLPYWSEAILVVLPEGVPVLLAALTKRVHPWIREVAHVKDVITAPKVGASAVTYLKEHLLEGQKIGVVGLDGMPWSAAEALIGSEFGPRIVDASDLFAKVRQPGDEQERALAARAQEIAVAAFNAIPAGVKTASDITSAIEASARSAGAEEVLQRIVPDLSTGAALARMEGNADLGSRYAVELSMAYKGAWVRIAKTFSNDAPPSTWSDADNWFEQAIKMASDELASGKLPSGHPGKVLHWSVESSVGVYPLTVIAGNRVAKPVRLPAGSLAVFSVHLELPDGHWFKSMPFTVGR